MVNSIKKNPFFIVDVFAERKFQGNQLAVVITNEDLKVQQMLAIAREMNFSETVFLDPQIKADQSFALRIFTPEKEIPFAGHPLLGAAFILKKILPSTSFESFKLRVPAGIVSVFWTVEKEDEFFWFEHFPPRFGKKIEHQQIMKILQLESNAFEQNLIPQEVSTGLPFIIVPLSDLNSVKRASINRHELTLLHPSITSKEILVFCTKTINPQNDLHVRVFVEYSGIPEDPATGSASGCLAAYLLKYKYLRKDKINLNIEQGYEIDRPSLIKIKAEKRQKSFRILTGGQVFLSAEGNLLL